MSLCELCLQAQGSISPRRRVYIVLIFVNDNLPLDIQGISKKRVRLYGWKIVAETRKFAHRLFDSLHRGSSRFFQKRARLYGGKIRAEAGEFAHKLFYAFHLGSIGLMRKYYSTILPMVVVCTLYFFPDEVRMVVEYGIWGKVALFVLSVIRCFSLIGFSVLAGAASFICGFRTGFLLFFFGSMLGTVLQYYAVRKRWVKIPGESLFRKIPSPGSAMTITMVRMCPLFPYDLVTIRLAYEPKATFGQFFRGTVFGSFPWFFGICFAADPHRESLFSLLAMAGKIWLSIILVMVGISLLVGLGTQKTKAIPPQHPGER